MQEEWSEFEWVREDIYRVIYAQDYTWNNCVGTQKVEHYFRYFSDFDMMMGLRPLSDWNGIRTFDDGNSLVHNTFIHKKKEDIALEIKRALKLRFCYNITLPYSSPLFFSNYIFYNSEEVLQKHLLNNPFETEWLGEGRHIYKKGKICRPEEGKEYPLRLCVSLRQHG